MTIELWLAYVVTTVIVTAVPGPTCILVITQSLAHGKKIRLPLILGVTAGDITALTLSLLGLGALLATSATWFVVIKWIGAGYLIYLGIMLWRDGGKTGGIKSDGGDARVNSRSHFMRSFLVTTFNPKGIIFFVAFMPQFVNPAGNAALQLFILGATFVVVGSFNAFCYAVFSARAAQMLNRPRARTNLNRVGALVLIGAGVFAAAQQRQ